MLYIAIGIQNKIYRRGILDINATLLLWTHLKLVCAVAQLSRFMVCLP
jgi:hypothetical protein